MAYLTETDLTDIIFQEKIDEIKRADTTIVPAAINGAIGEAKSYLSRFDLLALFGNDETPATVTDQNLKDQVVALAVWRLARRANPGLDTEYLKVLRDEAIEWVRRAGKGEADPEGWPLKPADEDSGTNPGQTVTWNSKPKRSLDF